MARGESEEMNPGWAKVKEAACYAGVSPRTFRKWLKEGLKCARLPTGTVLVKLTWVDAYLEKYSDETNAVNEIVDAAIKDFKNKRRKR